MASESPPTWDPERFATGISRIDEQHEMLFRITHDYRTALGSGEGRRVYGDLLQSLRLFTEAHFGFEEDVMASCRCPVADQNRAAHEAFVVVLAGFRQRYDATGFAPDDARAMVDELDRWLSEHICTIDVMLRGRVVPT